MSKRSARTARNKKNRIYQRESGICHYCGTLCHPFGDLPGNHKKDSATLDHIQTRYEGGTMEDHNLVLACWTCNNRRSCIPYDVFVEKELWRPENVHNCAQFRKLFSLAADPGVSAKKKVWLVEMYVERADAPVAVQNWGIFDTAERVQSYMKAHFPAAIRNEDDDLGYIGYHFDENHLLKDVSFVANSWDLQ